jgi:hypothetical protein
MLEAKLMHQFSNRWATYDGDAVRPPHGWELADPAYETTVRFWVDRKEVDRRLGAWTHNWLVGWRDICRSTDERTIIAFASPRSATDFTIRLGFLEQSELAVVFLAAMNSFVLDYIARQKVSGTHLADYITKQLPFPSPGVFSRPTPWLSAVALEEWVRVRVVELVYSGWDMAAFGIDQGCDCPPFRWDPERRAQLRSELDGAFFHLYGCAEEDVDYVMETFLTVKRRDEAKFGHYRTKSLILDVYRKMADAMTADLPFATTLDPPPADPRIAHEATRSALVRE